MRARRIRIGCFLASVFVLSFLDPHFTDEALARPVHQLIHDGKSQSGGKPNKGEVARSRAAGRGTEEATSSRAPPHLDSKGIAVEPTPALVHREEAQGQRFHLPSLRHNFSPVSHPLTRRNFQPPARNSIGVSLPSYIASSRTEPLTSRSRPAGVIVPGTLSVEPGAPSRIGNLNPRPVAPGGEARGALPTRPRTAAISGTGIVHRGIGPSQIGGPAHLTR